MEKWAFSTTEMGEKIRVHRGCCSRFTHFTLIFFLLQMKKVARRQQQQRQEQHNKRLSQGKSQICIYIKSDEYHAKYFL